jgi:hypothetical protein
LAAEILPPGGIGTTAPQVDLGEPVPDRAQLGLDGLDLVLDVIARDHALAVGVVHLTHLEVARAPEHGQGRDKRMPAKLAAQYLVSNGVESDYILIWRPPG